MKSRIRQKLFLISLIVLTGNGFLGYSVYESNQKLQDSEKWVNHTETVIYLSGNILSNAKDIEIATRGFIITNDSTLIEPLYTAQKAVFADLNQLRQFTRDNYRQQRRIDKLSFCISKLLSFSFKNIELRRTQGLMPAVGFALAKEGKYYTDQISQITHTLQSEEDILLKIRKHANERSSRELKLFSRIMFFTMVCFTILLLIFIGKYLLQNEEKEKHTADLAIANEERAKMVADLMLRNADLQQFAYIVSHNLRAPVANIIGASSALNDLELSSEDKEILLNGISSSVMRLDDVVRDLNQILQGKDDIIEITQQSSRVEHIL